MLFTINKKHTFFILLMLLSVTIVYSQEVYKTQVDSLFQVAKNDTVFNAYEDLSDLISRASGEDGEKIFKYAISRDSTELSRMFLYQGYGRNLGKIGQMDAAIAYRRKGLKLAEKNGIEGMVVYYHNSLAGAYHFKSKLDSATYHLNIAEAIAENNEKNRGWLWNIYYNRGLVQGSLGNLDAAAYYYRLMWENIKNTSNPKQKGFALYTIAYFFTEAGNYPEDQIKFVELLSAHYDNKDPDVPSGHISVQSLFKDEIKKENIAKYKNIVHLSDSLDQINSFYHSTETLVRIYGAENRYEEGIQYLKNAEQKILGVQKPHFLIGIYQALVKNHMDLKDYEGAFYYKNKEVQIRDSILSEKMRKNVANLEVKFEAEKKDRQIAQQALDIQKRNSQKIQLIGGLVALGILLLMTSVFFRKRLRYQKTMTSQKEAIHKQKVIELQQENKLLALNGMIEGQETERIRIAKDLHDSLGGLLSTVKAHFNAVQNEVKMIEELNITQKTNELIDEACTEVRRISHNMIPHALTISGVPGAVEDLVETLQMEGFEVELEIKRFPSEIPKAKQSMLYRLIQEIISNIRKHAHAKSILIQIFGIDDGIGLIIEDDGHGFNYKDAIAKDGVGLKSINSRVKFLDGSIDWDTSIGKGTTITINIPKV